MFGLDAVERTRVYRVVSIYGDDDGARCEPVTRLFVSWYDSLIVLCGGFILFYILCKNIIIITY